ncbi:transcriptional regulator ATRX isoform X1 [Musca domestica]|uniref:Transcriptional regulator ATRX isoform X1 n=1 Tax=Musca domestica TaxID=7370 RepID=A0A9J7CR83_MUSDO|nr:transcriptional regulator ATRX isoform X1 [Musca domestica]
MEKETINQNNTATTNLDLVLENVQNSISCLNPFDRTPNIMDDEMNSVTQEELEANLSTDCPTTSGNGSSNNNNSNEKAPTSWDLLIQSVLDDTSTQDALIGQQAQQEAQGNNNLSMLAHEESEILEIFQKEMEDEMESGIEWRPGTDLPIEPAATTDKLPGEPPPEMENNRSSSDKPEETRPLNDTTEIAEKCEESTPAEVPCEVGKENAENSNENVVSPVRSSDDSLPIKEELSIGSEIMLSQNLQPDCFYDETINLDDDDDNELCQVEVYATTSTGDTKTNVKQDISNSEKTNIKNEPNDDDEEGDVLSNASSISMGNLEEFESQLNEEMPDQENDQQASDENETNSLSIINSDHCYSQEIVGKNEVEVLKRSLLNYARQTGSSKSFEKIANLVQQINHCLESDKEGKEGSDESMGETVPDGGSIEEERDSGMDENPNQNESNSLDVSMENETVDEASKQRESEKQNESISDRENESDIQPIVDNSIEAMPQRLETPSENQEIREIPQENVENLNLSQNTEILSQETQASSQCTKETTSEEVTSEMRHLPDNCSEPLEHRIFEEEFEILCKTGNLVAKNKVKDDLCSELVQKLKDFAINLQRDCEHFSTATTNIEVKLHDYIQQQYRHFQTQFKPYCYEETRSIEIQTDFKKTSKGRRRKLNQESKQSILNASDRSSGSSSELATSSENEEGQGVDKPKRNRVPKKSSASDNETTNRSEENFKISPLENQQSQLLSGNFYLDYDDGINLTQYVQSEIFERETNSSPNSSLDEEDSDKGENNEVAIETSSNNNEDGVGDDEDSDADIFFKPKKKKKSSAGDGNSDGDAANSSKKSRKSHTNDDVSHNSESDKENLSVERKERKSHQSMDEDERNDKEIERLLNIDGLAKRSVANSGSSKISDKSKTKAQSTKSQNDRFDFMDVEFGSDDEVKSEAEEEVITEKQFLERCNEDIKRQMLDESSTDSEELEEEDEDLLLGAASEEDDESGKNSPLVDKFLKTFVVDDSDNEGVMDEDDEIDLDSDKEQEPKENGNKEGDEEEATDLSLKEKENEDVTEADAENGDGDPPTATEIELLNDNLLFRKRGSRPQKLDKMLSDAEKRKRISKIDEELICLSSESENSDVEEIDAEPSQSTKPRAIKPMLRPDQLAGETLKAQKQENERIARLEKKHNMLDKVLKDRPDVDKNKDLILDYIKETKQFIRVDPSIVKLLKPHQFDGVRFMYDSCYGGVDALKKSPGSGCILAHCMGLGKTLQLIALLHTVISYKELKTTKILVLCPKSTVMNWADEIIRWLGPLRQKNLKVYTFNDTSDINEKLGILHEWSQANHNRAGCLLIGYEAFRTLVFYHSYKNRGNISAHRLEEIRQKVNNYLLQPGADLVICDEGHIIKNSKSAISMAVAQIVTPRRIVLTGTPIQNNLKEYYSMVNFIKPLFLGTEKEFANLYANPIKNGQHKDSGKTDIKIMKQRSFVLHKKLSKFVQRKEAELLKTFLPQKFEYVLFIPMTEVQNNLYEHILNAIKNRDEHYRGKGLITDYTCLRKIWTHPKVLEDAWKNAVSQRNKKEVVRQKQKDHNSDDDQPDDIYDSQTGQMSVTNDWWRSLLTKTDLESIMPSNKLRTMFKILQMCEEKREKCLIFSAFVAVLNVVEYFFKKITENDETVRKELNITTPTQWHLGKDYYRLDGKTPKSIRHAMINEFNNQLNERARVFLISAKAGGQGINLIGANRVIILDTSWNPSNDQQNIFRVFRLGQKRNCYIYRLLAMGTMEEKVYSRSVTKQAMSFRVVDEQQIDRHYNMAELAELYILTVPDKSKRPTPILPQDSILARLLRSYPELVYKYHEHDSLLENKVEQELSEQEKNEAWTAYERDLQISSELNEKPNIEDLQNKFNAQNLANYMSPYSGLDVSTANTNTNNNNKNMSGLFGPRGFAPHLLQSLLGPNSTPSTTQQYLDMLNYYKNLNAYADLSPYSALTAMAAGRMPPTGPPASANPAANPLAALGDLSMYGLPSSALQGLSATSAGSMNLASSVLANALPPPPPPQHGAMSTAASSSAAASMYTSSASTSMVNAVLSSAGMTNTTNSNALSSYEQYQQSLRNSYSAMPSMYSYAGDFGIGSSGSTILDKSKTGKSGNNNNNNKHSTSSSKNSTNLPGGSKSNNTPTPVSLYSSASSYLNQQQQSQQHHQSSRPSSRNMSADLSNKSKNHNPSPSAGNSLMPSASSSGTTMSTSSPPSAFTNPPSNANNTTTTKSNDPPPPTTNSLINYRRSESSGGGANNSTSSSKPANSSGNLVTNPRRTTGNLEQSKGNNNNNSMGGGSNKSSMAQNHATTTGHSKHSSSSGQQQQSSAPSSSSSSTTFSSSAANQKSQQSHTTTGHSKHSSATGQQQSSTSAANQKSQQSQANKQMSSNGSTKSSGSADSSRTLNMGILYPKNQEKQTTSSKPSSPMNMGIVYPRGAGKPTTTSTSEMQIIPTSSPPGTTSISKQLNDLSPSISLTAVTKQTGSQNKSLGSANVKTPSGGGNSSAPSQSIQINKILQNNPAIRRTNSSPVTTSSSSSSAMGSSPNLAKSQTTNSSSNSLTSNILARFKANSNHNNKSSSNSNPPSLQRANTTLAISKTPNVNITTKSPSGLIITNVKTPIKQQLQNIASKVVAASGSQGSQVSTLAKQQAAVSVAKSNVQQRTATPISSANLQKSISNTSTTTLPSISTLKRAIIKKTNLAAAGSQSGTAHKFPTSLTTTPSLTVTSSSTKLPIISSVKSISPAMAASMAAAASSSSSTLNKSKSNPQILSSSSSPGGTLVHKPSVMNVAKTLAQMQKRMPSSMSATMVGSSSTSTSQSAGSSGGIRNTVNIRPVGDAKQNSSNMMGGSGGGGGSASGNVYIIETNINDKKVAIGAPTRSGGGTTVTKVSAQNPNKRKSTDPLSKELTIESKRMKN